MSDTEKDWDGTMPSLSEPWPIPIVTQDPARHRDPERRARWIEDFNRGADERNAERLASTVHHTTATTRQP